MKRLLLILIAIFCFFPNLLQAAPALQYQGEITSPRPNAVLRGQVAIEGTAYHPELWKYEVWFTPGLNPNVPDEQWIRLLVKEEQAVLNGQLAIWNTSAIADGVYTLRLRVVRRDGNWQDVNVYPLNVANSAPLTPTVGPVAATPTALILPTVPPLPTPIPLPPTPIPQLPTPIPLPPTPTVPTATPIPVITETPIETATIVTQTPSVSPTKSATITPFISATITTISTVAVITPTATLTAVAPPTITPLRVISTTVPITTTIQEEATETPIIIEQPTIIIPTVEPTAEMQTEVIRATIVRNGTDTEIPSLVPDVGNLFDPKGLANACLTGMAFTASIFLLVGVLYLLKSLIRLFQ